MHQFLWRMINNSTMIHVKACNQEFFRLEEFSWNQGTSVNISSTIHENFLLETLKSTFQMRNSTQDYHNQGIFSKIGTWAKIKFGGKLNLRGDLKFEEGAKNPNDVMVVVLKDILWCWLGFRFIYIVYISWYYI